MPKYIKSKEDIAALKELKQNIKDLISLRKETTIKIAAAKLARKTINDKYKKIEQPAVI